MYRCSLGAQQSVGALATNVTKALLFDAANPTGYAQAIEEFEVVVAAPSSWVRTRSTVVGLDVLSTSTPRFAYPQSQGEPVPQPDAPLVLVYDAGGSVRDVLANHEAAGDLFTFAERADGATGGTPGASNPVLPQRADYDAFGELILFAPAGQSTPSVRRSQRDAAITDLEEALLSHLTYRGEQYDPHLRMQYLRARHYDQGTGRFTRVDPFAGVLGQPVTLHKYLYGNGDAVNASDPSGLFSYSEINLTQALAFSIASFSVVSGLLDLRQAASYAIQARAALLSGDVWGASALCAAAAVTGGLGLLNIALGVAGFRSPPSAGLRLAFHGLSAQGGGPLAMRGAWVAIESTPAMRQWVWSRVVPALWGFFFATGPGGTQGGSSSQTTPASRETKPRIENGNTREGWQHIDERHVSGTSPAGPGDLFAPGTTREQIGRLAEELVSNGQRISVPARRVQIFERRTTLNGLHARYRVVVDSHDGNRVLTIFPVLSE